MAYDTLSKTHKKANKNTIFSLISISKDQRIWKHNKLAKVWRNPLLLRGMDWFNALENNLEHSMKRAIA